MSGGHLGFATRLKKLRAMSLTEIRHRLTYAAAIRAERRAHQDGTLRAPDRLRKALGTAGEGADWRARLCQARREHHGAFFASAGERLAMQAAFDTRFTAERDAIASEAAKVKARRFEFFGQTFEYPDAIAWQVDPPSRRPWPAVYHADVPVHRGDTGSGDVKYVWELSRQQFLVDLAKAWFVGGDRDAVADMQVLVRSWIAGNPYATGVNWSCALEPAFQVFSWLWSYHLTVDVIDDDFHVEWLEALLDHGHFIERHLELYSSPYNHLIAEGAALYGLAVSFPELADAPRWRRRALDVLVGRLPQQFYADGGSVEQSPFYHHATVGYYLFAALLGRAAGDELPAQVWSAIERGLEYSLALSQPDGYTPPIGGADDGKPIRMEHLPFWDFRPYLSIGAVLFARPDFKAVAGRFHEDALWMLGPEALTRFDRLSSAAPAALQQALPDSGYFVMRTSWNHDASYVCFDCGEQAAGMRTDAIPNSMHGHADCLSLSLWLSGKRVLVDSGLFAYNYGGEWEAHFRRTAAHNTAMVDGHDQATHLGKMAWAYSYTARQEGFEGGEWGAWVAGSHDGFRRLGSGVRHRRTVWLRPAGYVVVLDEFEAAEAGHEADVIWQFAPGALRPAGTNAWSYDDTVSIAVIGAGAVTAAIAEGGERPQDGWIAPSLGVRVPAPRLTVHGALAPPLSRIVTILGRDAVVRDLSPAGADASLSIATVRTAGGTDVVVAATRGQGLGPDAPITTKANLAICRASGGTLAAWATHHESCSVDTAAIAALVTHP